MNKTANRYQPVRTSVELSGNAIRTLRSPPPADLADVVMDFWEYRVQPSLDYVPVQVFPSGCVVLRFNVRPDHVESVLYGPSLNNNMKGLFFHDWTIFGAALYPEKAYHLLGLSLDEIRDLRMHMSLFWPQELPEIHERLWQANHFAERVTVVCEFLRRILRADVSPASDFLNVFQDIVHLAPHAEDIGLIARRHGTSGRTLRRQFNKYLGLGPKQTDRLVRVQNSMRTLHGSPNLSLAAIAAEQGFSDQAHLSREFRSLTGYTPRGFVSSMGSIHDASRPAWQGMDARFRHTRSPEVIRFE